MIALAAVLSSCGDSAGPPRPSEMRSSQLPSSTSVGAVLNPAVTVVDSRGTPLADIPVSFQVTGGGGTITVASATTGPSGTVSPGTWTLGPQPGTNMLVATVTGISPATFTVQTSPDAVASIQALPGGSGAGTVGQGLAVPPAVQLRDRFNNAVPGAAVTFTVSAGSLEGAAQTSDASGQARAGSWVLGITAGQQTWTARVGAVAVNVAVEAEAGPATVLAVAEGAGQKVPIGLLAPVPPAAVLRDQFGNAVRNTPVLFEVAAGEGVLTGGSATTNNQGVARVQSWRMGTVPGINRLRVSSAGLPPIFIEAEAEFRPPFEMTSFAGDSTTCPQNSAGCRFTVRVRDIMSAPAPGQTVIWTNASGQTQSTTTTVQGFASITNFGTALAQGAHAMTARLESTGQELAFTYGVVAGGGYNIELRYTAALPAFVEAAFQQARNRWQQVITGDLDPVMMTVPANQCFIQHDAVNEVVDDLLILVEVTNIDGAGGVLGGAAPCFVRVPGNLPILGVIRLDVADLELMNNQGFLADVITHEMGHVIGIGSLWLPDYFPFVTGAGGSDPRYTAVRGVSSFVLGGGFSFDHVPVENVGGPGSAGSHWRESAMANELMTSLIGPGSNPLSATTVGALLDMGYQVNFGAADPYSLPGSTVEALLRRHPSSIRLVEEVFPAPRPWPVGAGPRR
jgi:hypothetical protein